MNATVDDGEAEGGWWSVWNVARDTVFDWSDRLASAIDPSEAGDDATSRAHLLSDDADDSEGYTNAQEEASDDHRRVTPLQALAASQQTHLKLQERGEKLDRLENTMDGAAGAAQQARSQSTAIRQEIEHRRAAGGTFCDCTIL